MIYQAMYAAGMTQYDIKMVHVEDYPCANRQEATMREKYWADLQGTLNDRAPYVHPDEEKEKDRARGKAYRQNNKEEIKARKADEYQRHKARYQAAGKAWRETNKDMKRAMDKVYYEKNKEHILEQQRAYYEANKEQINARNKAYWQKNKEHLDAKSKEYREKHRDKQRAYMKAYHQNKQRFTRKKAVM
jgi:hypothetical protein